MITIAVREYEVFGNYGSDSRAVIKVKIQESEEDGEGDSPWDIEAEMFSDNDSLCKTIISMLAIMTSRTNQRRCIFRGVTDADIEPVLQYCTNNFVEVISP
jgi:hypothetical protein